jgi:hypothetical protein
MAPLTDYQKRLAKALADYQYARGMWIRLGLQGSRTVHQSMKAALLHLSDLLPDDGGSLYYIQDEKGEVWVVDFDTKHNVRPLGEGHPEISHVQDLAVV